MIINDLDGYYIVFDTKNWNTELDTLVTNQHGDSYLWRKQQSGLSEETDKVHRDGFRL